MKISATPLDPAPVRRVDLDQSWVWLQRGWADFCRVPLLSGGIGAVIVAAGIVLAGLLYVADVFFEGIVPLAAGFMLVGPVAAIAFYDISRTLSQGGKPSLAAALSAWRSNCEQVAYLGLLLLLIMLAWLRAAMLLFALFFGSSHMRGFSHVVEMFVSSPVTLPFIVTGTIIGGVLAFLVFSVSVVSMQFLIDRPSTVMDAVGLSFSVLSHNVKPLLLWAVLIVFFVGIGMATAFLGLVVTLPLLGHASWHAYVDLAGYDRAVSGAAAPSRSIAPDRVCAVDLEN